MSDIIVAQPWEIEAHLNPIRNTNHKYLKFMNTRVFSDDAYHFLRYGYYTNAPYGSKDWVEYWDEQEKRCIEGYSIGGVRITGRHYFFLNFTMIKARPVDLVTGKPGNRKVLTFPQFLDHQYYLFHELEECFGEGPHKNKPLQGMVILKSRRLGVTYVNAGGVIAYNFTFVPHSNTVIGSYEQLHYDTLLNGVHFALNHINKSTDWGKRRQKIDRRDHIRASFVYTDEGGMPIEDGYMSEVQAISFKDNPFKTIGASIYTMCFEEAGRFRGLLDAYAIAEPTFRDGHLMTGIPLIFGTGGDVDSGGKDLAEMFYDPKTYGLKTYENIYDENSVGECGWFIDALWYATEAQGNKVQFDEFGNSHRDVAKEALMKIRNRQAKGNRSTYRKFITQSPLTPAEALLRIEGSRFDTLRAQNRLAHILANKAEFIDSIYLAKLIADSESNTVRYEYDPLGIPLREFPIKSFDQAQGCVEIYEQPQRAGTEIQTYRYIAGIDSYDDDVSSGDSVGSILILDKITDRIVAHYKGRPPANKFYETCRRLLKYYGATAAYERRNKGIYGYFFNAHSLHLLCDEPNILKDRGISKANTLGNNAHPYTEYAYTPTGIKSWKDIKVGDELFGDDGKPTKVIEIPYDGIADIYEVELIDGRIVRASEGHLWKIINDFNKENILSTSDLLKEYKILKKHKNGKIYDRKVLKVPTQKCLEFNHNSVSLDPYTLGLLLGDGLLSNFSRTKNMEKFVEEAKFIPNIYKYNSKEIRLEILKGLIGIDRTMDINGTVEFSTTSSQLCLDVLFLARSLGYNATSWKSKTEYKDLNGTYVRYKDANTVMIWIHDDLCKLPRKLSQLSTYKNSKLINREIGTTIKNVKYVGKERCKCVTVDNTSGCYLINELIVTHNSKGIAPSVPVNQYGLELAQIWMDSRAYGEEEGSEVTNMDRIRSVALLREIIGWNSNNNFDDISALIMLMIYREDLLTVKVDPYKKQSTILDDPFWGRAFNKGVQYRYKGIKNIRND